MDTEINFNAVQTAAQIQPDPHALRRNLTALLGLITLPWGNSEKRNALLKLSAGDNLRQEQAHLIAGRAFQAFRSAAAKQYLAGLSLRPMPFSTSTARLSFNKQSPGQEIPKEEKALILVAGNIAAALYSKQNIYTHYSDPENKETVRTALGEDWNNNTKIVTEITANLQASWKQVTRLAQTALKQEELTAVEIAEILTPS